MKLNEFHYMSVFEFSKNTHKFVLVEIIKFHIHRYLKMSSKPKIAVRLI